MRINREVYEGLNAEDRAFVDEQLAKLEGIYQRNPLEAFEPHPVNGEGRRPQLEFIEAMSPVVAAFAGNQFGKSTVLTVCALRECLNADLLPGLLAGSKRYVPPVSGWILCPTEDKIFDSFQPAFEKWCPPSAFKGGNWGKAFNGARMMLSFQNGSVIHFKTYKQDPSTLGGAALHFVGYDEPPPKKHREECRLRLVRQGGFEMFAMTPLDTNTGYVRRVIWKQRENPEITVVRGSIHENPTLNKRAVQLALGDLSDIWRRARELGEFVDVGGLIYPEFEACVLPTAPEADVVRPLDIVVAIDPGIRNAGVAFECFDGDNTCGIFDELLLQDSTPRDYAVAIRGKLDRWGLREDDVQFVVDPAARSRGQTNAETVMSALAVEGIFCSPGQNDVQAGIGQGRIRMAHKRLWVSPECRVLRDEADEYAAVEPKEGRDDSHLEPHKSNDHVLDACLVPGTLVSMARGDIPIQHVNVGDMVRTRDGLRRVSRSHMTRPDAEVWTLHLEDGRTLTGTENHPVFVLGQGWADLGSVRYGDMLVTCLNAEKKSSGMESSSTAIPTPTSPETERTSPPPPFAFIVPYGSSTMDLSLAGSTSIMWTRTPPTTTSRTLSLLNGQNTYEATGPPSGEKSNASGCAKLSSRRPSRGTQAQKDERGMPRTLGMGSAGSSVSPAHANTVGICLSAPEFAVTSAPTPASPRGGVRLESTTSTGSVSSAVPTSVRTGTPRSQLVPVRVVGRSRAGRSAVYNLTVAGKPEYFANGVLVHNCRYGWMERFWDPVVEDEAPARQLGWVPGTAPAMPSAAVAVGPMGAMS